MTLLTLVACTAFETADRRQDPLRGGNASERGVDLSPPGVSGRVFLDAIASPADAPMPGPMVYAVVTLTNLSEQPVTLLLPDRFAGGAIQRNGDEILVGPAGPGGPTRSLGLRTVTGPEGNATSVGFISPIVQFLRVGAGADLALAMDLQSSSGRFDACVAREVEAIAWPAGVALIRRISTTSKHVEGELDPDSSEITDEVVVTEPTFQAIFLAHGVRCHTFLADGVAPQ